MPAYLTTAEFRAKTVMPSSDVDALEAIAPGFVAERLGIESARIDARLRKRYAAPFASPVPDVIVGWLVAVVTEQAMRRRGIDPNDKQADTFVEDANRARDELLEAANSETGLFDLPLRKDTTATGIVKGAPYVYSERSPTVWTRIQRSRGREERRQGRGTGG